jgi:hypothetical protein
VSTSAQRLSLSPRAALQWHLAALAIYALLAALLSWPLVADFTTEVPPGDDTRQNIAILWGTREWLAGSGPLFDRPLLYYPYGASLLSSGLGPLTGLFALPFWLFGTPAGHNGAVLVALTLTGYAMFLLARELELEPAVALFCGALLLTAPICLAGLRGHVTKLFLGCIPLTLLAQRRALDPVRSPWWALATGVALLSVLLHAGYQFVMAALAVGLFALIAILRSQRGSRSMVVRRAGLLVAACAVCLGPLLFAILQAGSELRRDLSGVSDQFSPDLLQFVLPFHESRLLGPYQLSLLERLSIEPSVETAVWLPWPALALTIAALVRVRPSAWPWALVLALALVLSVGPTLKLAGHTFQLPLPYNAVVALPGLSFMRVPGRFMMLGYVLLAALAGMGLADLRRRYPANRTVLLGSTWALSLAFIWPQSWSFRPVPEVPQFYRQLADAPDQFGVFDLPFVGREEPLTSVFQFVPYSSYAQFYQITHGKGIAAGYLSRTYPEHPLFPELLNGTDLAPTDLLLDGAPANPLASAEATLAHYGYRYVVAHRRVVESQHGEEADFAATLTRQFVAGALGDRAPIHVEPLADVYAVNPTAPFRPTLALLRGWYGYDVASGWRWALSPARLYVAAPELTPALLELQPALLHDPAAPDGLGRKGVLTVTSADGVTTTVQLQLGERALVPVVLPAGGGELRLSLAAGNFRPTDYGQEDPSIYSFALHSIALRTPASFGLDPDLLVNGRPQATMGAAYALAPGPGWYGYEPGGVRWVDGQAELLIYSSEAKRAVLQLTPAMTIADDHGPGELTLSLDGTTAQVAPLVPGVPARFAMELRHGWNQVTIESSLGAARPADLFPGSSDTRSLSYAVTAIDLQPLP